MLLGGRGTPETSFPNIVISINIIKIQLKYTIIKQLNSGAFGTVYEIEGDNRTIYAFSIKSSQYCKDISMEYWRRAS